MSRQVCCIETLVFILFLEQRADAERKLSVLSSNPEMLDQGDHCSLDLSAALCASTVREIVIAVLTTTQHFAAISMSKLLTIHWGRFSSQQKTDVFTFLANKGPSLQSFVVAALVNLLARITKLGWFQNPGNDVTEEVSQCESLALEVRL
eukprot:444712-Hanusia_phi.AAC.2